MENPSYTENIAEVHSDKIVKKLNIKRLSCSALGMLLSAVTLAIPTLNGELPSSANVLLFTLGTAGLICSLAAMLHGARCCVFKPTGSPLQISSKYVSCKAAAEIRTTLERNLGETLPHAEPNASNARLNIWKSKDGKFAAAQLSLYRPHEFYPVTPIVHVSWPELKPYCRTR